MHTRERNKSSGGWEKRETILSRNIGNTRPRDFYDILALKPLSHTCKGEMVREALQNTAVKRGSLKYLENTKSTMEKIESDGYMNSLWEKYSKKQPYAKDFSFADVCLEVKTLLDKIGLLN